MDCETGEALTGNSPQGTSHFDLETGELVDDEIIKPQCNGQRFRTRFLVPKSYLNQKSETKNKYYYLSSTQETFTLTSKKKVIELKEVIIAEKNPYDKNSFAHDCD